MQLAERELLFNSNEIGSENSLTAAVAQSLSNETKITNKLRRLFVDSKLPSPTSSSSSSLTKVLPLFALSYLISLIDILNFVLEFIFQII